MYHTKRELASMFGCSERTIERRVSEMEQSGLYPRAVLAGIGRVRVNMEDFEDFLLRRRRTKWKEKKES